MKTILKKEKQRNSPFRIFFVDYLHSVFNSIDESRYANEHPEYVKKRDELYFKTQKSYITDRDAAKEYYIGLVDYIPTNKKKDYTKSCDIFCHTYKSHEILEEASKSVFRILHDFVVDNNITNIQLSKNDIDAYKTAKLNILDAFTDIDNLRIYIKDYTK